MKKASVLSLEEKRENLQGRMYQTLIDLANKDEKSLMASISWNKPNTKIYAKNWLIPSINLKYAFMYTVKNNPELLENARIKLIYDFFLKNDICTNCDNCQGYCYNWKSYRFGASALKGRFYRLYQLLAYMDKVEEKLSKQCNNNGVYRLHVEGDIFSDEYMEMIIRLCEKNPNAVFYTYTKHYDRITKYSHMIPSNLKIQLSYDEENTNLEKIKALNKQGHKVFYTSSLKDKKPVYSNLDQFNNDKVTTCLGKCELCKNCTQDDNRIIKCDLH